MTNLLRDKLPSRDPGEEQIQLFRASVEDHLQMIAGLVCAPIRCLCEMKGVLYAQTMAMFQRQLKVIGAVTGNVRDLDVVLLKNGQYIDLVPDFLKLGITLLFRTRQRKRRHAWDRMVKTMDGVDFESAPGELDAFVQAGPGVGSTGPDGDRSIGDLARAAIYKRYRRIIKQGSWISGTTADEKLHALRIDCKKKLRYLLEFFASLLPAEAMSTLIEQQQIKTLFA